MDTDKDIYYMKQAYDQALIAQSLNEIPVGCVFVKNNIIISKGHNNTNIAKNGIKHAEIMCIDDIITHNGHYNESYFKDIDVYVTVEPCIMCAYALRIIGIRKVFYGCRNDRFGGNGSIYSLHNDEGIYPKYESIGGILSDESFNLLKEFYSLGNTHLPPNKRHRKNEDT